MNIDFFKDKVHGKCNAFAGRLREFCPSIKEHDDSTGKRVALYIVSGICFAAGLFLLLCARGTFSEIKILNNVFPAKSQGILISGIVFTCEGILMLGYVSFFIFQDSKGVLRILCGFGFVIVCILYILKTIIMWILHRTGQDKIYEFYILYLLSLLCAFGVAIAAIRIAVLISANTNDSNTNIDLLIFGIVVVSLVSYFCFCRCFTWINIKSNVKTRQKIRLRKEGKPNDFRTLCRKRYREERKQAINEEWAEIEDQYVITKLSCYVILNILLLCNARAFDDEVWSIVVADLTGLTSVAAILREIESVIKRHEDIEKEKKAEFNKTVFDTLVKAKAVVFKSTDERKPYKHRIKNIYYINGKLYFTDEMYIRKLIRNPGIMLRAYSGENLEIRKQNGSNAEEDNVFTIKADAVYETKVLPREAVIEKQHINQTAEKRNPEDIYLFYLQNIKQSEQSR